MVQNDVSHFLVKVKSFSDWKIKKRIKKGISDTVIGKPGTNNCIQCRETLNAPFLSDTKTNFTE